MLASSGNALALEPDQPVDEKQYELRELFSVRGALVKRQTKARISEAVDYGVLEGRLFGHPGVEVERPSKLWSRGKKSGRKSS